MKYKIIYYLDYGNTIEVRIESEEDIDKIQKEYTNQLINSGIKIMIEGNENKRITIKTKHIIAMVIEKE